MWHIPARESSIPPRFQPLLEYIYFLYFSSNQGRCVERSEMIFNPRDEVEGMVGRKNIKYEEPFLHKVCSILLTKKSGDKVKTKEEK